jgi:hypothetical protein
MTGDPSEDFIIFKEKFSMAARDNRMSRRDQVEKLREVLTDKALANLPPNAIGTLIMPRNILNKLLATLTLSSTTG